MAATPITAIAVDHLMTRPAAIIGHHRQAQTRRSKGMSEGFLVHSVLGHNITFLTCGDLFLV
jgi:hypothetical protein